MRYPNLNREAAKGAEWLRCHRGSRRRGTRWWRAVLTEVADELVIARQLLRDPHGASRLGTWDA
jgi:hypothetical protein